MRPLRHLKTFETYTALPDDVEQLAELVTQWIEGNMTSGYATHRKAIVKELLKMEGVASRFRTVDVDVKQLYRAFTPSTRQESDLWKRGQFIIKPLHVPSLESWTDDASYAYEFAAEHNGLVITKPIDSLDVFLVVRELESVDEGIPSHESEYLVRVTEPMTVTADEMEWAGGGDDDERDDY